MGPTTGQQEHSKDEKGEKAEKVLTVGVGDFRCILYIEGRRGCPLWG